jgi:hypothetical protein
MENLQKEMVFSGIVTANSPQAAKVAIPFLRRIVAATTGDLHAAPADRSFQVPEELSGITKTDQWFFSNWPVTYAESSLIGPRIPFCRDALEPGQEGWQNQA